MTIAIAKRRAVAVAGVLCLTAHVAAAQDAVARAKDFYVSADYEQALQVLDALHANLPASETAEVGAYKVFCLVALGRTDEATQAIQALVHSDPLYHPSETQASPRVRTFFEDVRRPLLPEVARQMYGHAKDDFDRKDALSAAAEFDRVIAILDEVGTSPTSEAGDLRTLATGFRDLSNSQVAAAAPPPAPAPAPAPTAPPTAPAVVAQAPQLKIYDVSDLDVVQPVTIARAMPPWHPSDPLLARQTLHGTLDVVIDERGAVIQASLTKSVTPLYDPQLLQAAIKWSFRPATKDGQPVRYKRTVDVVLQPTTTAGNR